MKFITEWKGPIFFTLLAVSIFSSFRFLGNWNAFWPYILVQCSVAHGVYSCLGNGKIHTLLGLMPSSSDPKERAVTGGMLLLVYIGMFFL